MGQIVRCPLIGVSCSKPITIEEKSFFLAEAEEPGYDRQHRTKAIQLAIADGYKIRSALDEKGINAFSCKICEMIQTCAYGIADITQRNPNVLLELGMMIALGKPTIILAQKEQGKEVELFSDLKAIEVIPFEEYLDIVEDLREVVEKLPPPVLPPNPIAELEKLQPKFVEELKKQVVQVAKEFKESIEEAKLDATSFGDEKKELSPQLNGRLKRLEEQLENVTRLGFITDAETVLSRAHYFYNRGDYEEAIANLNVSLGLDSHNPANFYNRGITYGKLEKHKEALTDYNRSLELSPDDPDTLDNRGITYAKLEKYKEAFADFNRSLELRPDHPSTLYNLACLFALQNKTNEALTYLEKAIKKSKKARVRAKTDEDFNDIREDPRFKKLIE